MRLVTPGGCRTRCKVAALRALLSVSWCERMMKRIHQREDGRYRPPRRPTRDETGAEIGAANHSWPHRERRGDPSRRNEDDEKKKA